MRSGLVTESIAMGVVSIMLFFITYRIIVGRFLDTKDVYLYQMFLLPFLLGASIHVTSEFVGLNERIRNATYSNYSAIESREVV
jgi:hypothetical protein